MRDVYVLLRRGSVLNHFLGQIPLCLCAHHHSKNKKLSPLSSVSTYLWPCPARIALIEVCGGGLIAQMIRGLLLLDDSLWRPPADSIHYTLLRQADARHIQMYGATNFSSGTTDLKAFIPVSVLRLSKRRLHGDCGRCRIHGSFHR